MATRTGEQSDEAPEPRWAVAVDLLARALHRVERPLDHAKRAVKQRLGLEGPVVAFPFRTYGRHDRLHIHGRVLEDKGITGAGESAGSLDNLRNMLRRYESDEVPGACVTASFGEARVSCASDDEGYFEMVLVPEDPRAIAQPWTEVAISLDQEPQPHPAHVRIVDPHASFGVISDMDDTVVKTGATTLFRQLRTLLLNNAATREPFDGVGALYQAFSRGADGQRDNPVFYVSSSPWNLVDLFEEFLEVHELPLGPIVLRDFGIAPGKLVKRDHLSHKVAAIERILDTYPHLAFVLVGDTGQKDAWVYRRVALDYPEQVEAIYLRDLAPNRPNPHIEPFEEELAQLGIPLLRVPDSAAAADHAHHWGLIQDEARRRVHDQIAAERPRR